MRRKAISFVVALSLLGTVLVPVGLADTELDRVNQKIEQLKQEQLDKEAKLDELDQRIAEIQAEVQETKQDIMGIDLRMNETQARIEALDQEIEVTSNEARQTANELAEAERRVAERDDLLKIRVRAMYEEGEISYLEVLLGAESFGDFIQRFHSLKLIVSQDQRILEEQKNDRDLIAQKKIEIEQQLAKLEGLFAEASELKAQYEQQRKQKKVIMAQLVAKERELIYVREEEETALQDMANQQADLLKRKKFLEIKQYYTGGTLAWPVPASYRITSRFGYRKDPFTGRTAGHKGLDIGAPTGTPIVAAEGGIVIVASYVRGYGNTVMIDHGGGFRTLYGHIRSGGIKVTVGQEVQRGQKVAEVGSTGRSTGPHLHFGVYNNGIPVNPEDYVKQ